jgi:hypothetical protein
MSTNEEQEDVGPGVELLAINLHDVIFHASGRAWDPDSDSSLSLSVGTTRPSRLEIIVQVSLEVDDGPVVRATVAYRLRLKVTKDLADGDLEAFLRLTAARLAPVIAYPYIRETLHGLAMKSGLPLVLPIANVGAMLNPDQVNVPPAPEEEDDDV